ncbi:MAG TPA: translational GTPase TypA [Kiritimatiellia bacterium]|nr:translational GTPase TypA [Kiritimatiellia bacterium]HMO98775.1 translational GTPase TypA [Kiritimatiellia bacterium]HMP98084.1 translational GTPase TypA [Kiritimatiellia bacterium]
MSYTQYRNIAIIAHVDHGKTTLVDQLLREGGAFRVNEAVEERAMDSMDLEKEKGITIKAKNASVHWNDYTINIVDTPGHADFGGEVERIMGMVDGVLLLVDALDGPQAQTRFVLKKALHHGLKVIVVINKVDRDHADPHRVHDQVLELLLELHASEDQFNAPFVYASARDGYAMHELGDEKKNMAPLFEAIVRHIPPPRIAETSQFRMLISNLDWSDYVGRIAIGKVLGGSAKIGSPVFAIRRNGQRERAVITKVFEFSGMKSAESVTAEAGNIVGISGFKELDIGDTISDQADAEPIPFTDIDPPTLQMQFCVNDSPFCGREGKYVTARHLKDRLIRETRTNISLKVEDTDSANVMLVSARGELQIAILTEQMRREGFEMLLSRPQVIMRKEGGTTLEPFETLWVDLPNDILGDVLQSLAARKGQVTHMAHHADRVQLEAVIPTRGLIGLETEVVNLSSGRAVMSHMFKEYAAHCGPIAGRTSGTLVSMEQGAATGYALDMLQERGRLFIGPGEEVYEGMIIGENPRAEDLPVNPTKAKQLTNMRASGKDKSIILEPPLKMSLEHAIEYIAGDEYIEVTPKNLRLRKKILNATQRKRAAAQQDAG